MRVLIVEDDLLIASLLKTVIYGLYGDVIVETCETVSAFRLAFAASHPDLLVVDWTLPDGDGSEIICSFRGSSPDTPVLVITGRKDRQTVLSAARYGVSAYLSKPFQIPDLISRLESIVPPVKSQHSHMQGLESFLADAVSGPVQLPLRMSPADLLAKIAAADELSIGELAEQWAYEPELTARLLELANGVSFRRAGQPCRTLKEALGQIGVRSSLEIALAMSLDMRNSLRHPLLQQEAQQLQERCQKLASVVEAIAPHAGLPAGTLRIAATLHCIGELAVLTLCQKYTDGGGEIDKESLESAFTHWAAELGNRLKVSWRIPSDIRVLIGACYVLPRGVVRKDAYLMRVGYLVLDEATRDGPQTKKLMSHLGLEPLELVAMGILPDEV